jgi:serine/threonine-protein kinase
VDPLLLRDTRAAVFSVSTRAGPGLVAGPLAIASLDSKASEPRTSTIAPHALLDVVARRAIAFVDGWLLYTRPDGKAIMAVRLDVAHRRVTGPPVPVLEDDGGNLETGALADNGTLLYLRRPRANSAVLVDAAGAVRPGLASAEGSFMYPRLSPDGKRFAAQVTSASGEDVWLFDIASRTPTRLTTSGKALHPTWTPDGRRIVYMRSKYRGLVSQPVDGSAADTLPGTEGAFGPTVTPNGTAVVYQQRSDSGWTIWSASLTGEGAPRKVVDDPFADYMPAVSPDGHWLAYVSSASGRTEVFARPFPGPGPAVQVSENGGTEPAWSPDGRWIYYREKGSLMAAAVSTPALAITSRTRQFRDLFDGTMPHRNYDVARDGKTFLMIAPSTAGSPEAVIVLNWLTQLREQLARVR